MPWWGWISIGTLLLLAEMTVVDLEFYLVFLGASALLTGLLSLSGVVLPYWVQWLVFAALAAGSLLLFRNALYSKLRPPPGDEIKEGVDGERGVASEAIAPGATGTISLRGSSWSARNVGAEPIDAGDACRVDGAEGLILDIRLSH